MKRVAMDSRWRRDHAGGQRNAAYIPDTLPVPLLLLALALDESIFLFFLMCDVLGDISTLRSSRKKEMPKRGRIEQFVFARAQRFNSRHDLRSLCYFVSHSARVISSLKLTE